MPKIGTTLNYKVKDCVNAWMIVEEPTKINTHYYCWCRCIYCGREKYVRVSDLNANTTNCRCQRKKKKEPEKPQKLKTISFAQWCEKNDRQDLLDRWDYDLNKYTPDIVACKSGYKIFSSVPKESIIVRRLSYLLSLITAINWSVMSVILTNTLLDVGAKKTISNIY